MNSPPVVNAVAGTKHQSFSDLALHPNGEQFLLAAVDGPVEIRRTHDLEQAGELKLPGSNARYATAVAISPTGEYYAAADNHENVYLIDALSHKLLETVEGGERTGSVRFPIDGTRLAAACAFQGGAYVGLFCIQFGGKLSSVTEIDRAHHQTARQEFVDTLSSLAFSPDSRLLAFWETSAIYHELRARGWRGNVVLCSANTGKVVWERSVDAIPTNDTRSLGEADHCMGYFTELCFTSDGKAAAIGVDGQVLVLIVADGSILSRHETGGTVYTVAASGNKLIAATSSGLSVLPYATSSS